MIINYIKKMLLDFKNIAILTTFFKLFVSNSFNFLL